MKILIFILIVFLAISCQEEKATTQYPNLVKELDWFLGKWSCKGDYTRQFLKEIETKSFKNENLQFLSDLEGHWIISDYISTFDGRPSTNRCQYGLNGLFTTMICIGMYEGHVVSKTLGWDDDTLTFEGEHYFKEFISDQKKIFKRMGKNQFTVKSRVENQRQGYKMEFLGHCERKTK